MATKAQVEKVLIEKYGRENLRACVHQYRGEGGRVRSMTLYYHPAGNPLGERGGNHGGSYKPEERRGWYFTPATAEDMPKPVMV
jgi:hypothetical protein